MQKKKIVEKNGILWKGQVYESPQIIIEKLKQVQVQNAK